MEIIWIANQLPMAEGHFSKPPTASPQTPHIWILILVKGLQTPKRARASRVAKAKGELGTAELWKSI